MLKHHKPMYGNVVLQHSHSSLLNTNYTIERKNTMKKICIFIVALMLLLTSCNSSKIADETTDNDNTTNGESTETIADIDLSDLQFEPIGGVTSSTLAHTADITSFKTNEETGAINTAPVIYNDGQYTYLIRRFPEELKSVDEIMEFTKGARINEIEIYENHQYSEPIEIVTLDELEGKSFSPYDLSYNSEKEEFYLFISQSGDPTFYTFSRKGEMLNKSVVSVNRLENIICLDGKLYVVKNSGYNGRASNLSVVDPVTDESAKIDEGVIDTFTENGLLYYIKNAQTADYRNVQRVCSYDPATGNITTVADIQTDETIMSFYYDSANEVVYFASTIRAFVCKDDEVIPVMDTYDASITICEADDKHLFTLIGSNQLSVYQFTDDPVSLDDQVEVLKVCIPMEAVAFETALSYAVDLMSAVGMPVKFEYTYIADDMSDFRSNEAEYANNMAKKFLAGDTDYDIFIVNSTMSELFEGKYYEDFSNYSAIMEFYDKLIPGIKELCTVDGKLALAPTTLSVDSMIFSPAALADPEKAPKTFDEFFGKYDELTEDIKDIADRYYFVGADKINIISTWLNELASNYFAEVISDETAENDLLRLFGCVSDLDEYEKIYLGSDHSDKSRKFSYYINLGTNSAGEEYNWVAWPKLGEEYKYSVDGSFLAVNPKSPNKELALKVITYYLNSLVSGEYTNKMHYVKEGEITANAEHISRDIDYKNSKYTSFAEQIADSIRKTVADDLFSFARDLCIQIEDGTLTPEEAASRTLRYLKMMRDE